MFGTRAGDTIMKPKSRKCCYRSLGTPAISQGAESSEEPRREQKCKRKTPGERGLGKEGFRGGGNDRHQMLLRSQRRGLHCPFQGGGH